MNIKTLKEALSTIKYSQEKFLQNTDSSVQNIFEDSCVKRFEYTLETSWKLAKKIFIQKYGKSEAELTMNNIFRFMEGYGYAKNWENWKEYYQKRNNTAHEYDFVKARALISLIPDFLVDVEYFLTKLKEENSDN